MKQALQDLFASADIKIGGSRPWDIQVHNPQFYARVLSQGSLGLGESYMDGWWECKALDQFFYKILRIRLETKAKKSMLWNIVKAKVINLQSKKRAFNIAKHHYNLGNDLFEVMLDKHLVYSCGYWKRAKTLDEAQEAKLDLICKKIGLKKGMRVLDIGCGWGSFAKFAAEKYKVQVFGITVSKEQVKLARERCKKLPVEIQLMDYRDLNQSFDRVISIGMFEHVGSKNYRKYMEIAHKCLKPEGFFLLHTIGSLISSEHTDPWIDKYIFPGSLIPSTKQISAAAEGLFVMEDWHNFGADYDKTLMAWHHNFTKKWGHLKGRYDSRFYRMWVYYLLCCAGSFRARKNQLWQVVFSKGGIPGGYVGVR